MNWAALYTYGAGIMTGFLFPHYHRRQKTGRPFFLFLMLMFWPAVAIICARSYYKTKQLPWAGWDDDGSEE